MGPPPELLLPLEEDEDAPPVPEDDDEAPLPPEPPPPHAPHTDAAASTMRTEERYNVRFCMARRYRSSPGIKSETSAMRGSEPDIVFAAATERA